VGIGLSGERGRNRTYNLLIKSQQDYPPQKSLLLTLLFSIAITYSLRYNRSYLAVLTRKYRPEYRPTKRSLG